MFLTENIDFLAMYAYTIGITVGSPRQLSCTSDFLAFNDMN